MGESKGGGRERKKRMWAFEGTLWVSCFTTDILQDSLKYPFVCCSYWELPIPKDAWSFSEEVLRKFSLMCSPQGSICCFSASEVFQKWKCLTACSYSTLFFFYFFSQAWRGWVGGVQLIWLTGKLALWCFCVGSAEKGHMLFLVEMTAFFLLGLYPNLNTSWSHPIFSQNSY